MRILTLSTIALATALSAGIASANPGVDQLAASAGVSANDFTQTQLIQLLDAQRDNDAERIAFIMSQAASGNASMTKTGDLVLSQDAQMAAAAGVSPGRYTLNELQQLIVAKRDQDTATLNFILSGANRAAANPAGVVTPGQAQLAASLGVNASEYTLAELTELYAKRQDIRNN